ncbi:MAG: acetolactate synthase small subunit [Oscillospiraceae bacterium]|jgi:acetolactate synthase-1/3 small subunit|nr:acetolactate synthase small subunit [Oscillospiraceae bacterium]MCI1989863.1 acetolactate synthase small subunit [Oscillospiraceae bacterium]MCI2034912.1 acetolactate synthase small subunit [Oscillospiraceae bacterium]
MKNTLSVLVENQPGVLSKVAGLFSRRGFNIDSLAVGITENQKISRMTIVVDGDARVVEQVEKQLNKMIPVIKVKVLEPGTFLSSEHSLVKVACKIKQHAEIMNIAELMHASIVDVAPTSLTLEFTGDEDRTQTLLGLLKPYGIKEVVRAGALAMEKGSETTLKQSAKA